METTSKLAKVANTMKLDAHVKHVEDAVMIQRKENLNQLKTIKTYLAGLKTGTHAMMAAKIRAKSMGGSGSFIF
jgi:hypothetical protein